LDGEGWTAEAKALPNRFDRGIHGPFPAGGLVNRSRSERSEAFDEFLRRSFDSCFDVNQEYPPVEKHSRIDVLFRILSPVAACLPAGTQPNGQVAAVTG
jgi:hypothetical protein